MTLEAFNTDPAVIRSRMMRMPRYLRRLGSDTDVSRSRSLACLFVVYYRAKGMDLSTRKHQY